MTDVALALPPELERPLAETASHHGHRIVARCDDAGRLAAQLALVTPELVIAAAEPRYLSAALVAACDAVGVRIIAVAEPGEARLARELGVLDVVDAPADWSSFGATAASAPPVHARRAARGRVVVVWGPAGAPGRTTLSVALASELAAAGESVALADADTHAASVAPALGLLDEAPGFAAACRLAGLGGLTTSEFDRVARIHRAGSGTFRVLTGLGRPSRWPELGADRVVETLTALRGWSSHTVVDVAASIEEDEELSSDVTVPRRNAATLAALRAADHVVVVGSADPIGLTRLLHAHAALLDLVGPPRTTVVVNRVRASAIGLHPQGQIRQTLHRFGAIDDPVLVPYDRLAFDAALLGGQTLTDAAPRSPARIALRDLVADRMLPRASGEVTTRRARRRATTAPARRLGLSRPRPAASLDG